MTNNGKNFILAGRNGGIYDDSTHGKHEKMNFETYATGWHSSDDFLWETAILTIVKVNVDKDNEIASFSGNS